MSYEYEYEKNLTESEDSYEEPDNFDSSWNDYARYLLGNLDDYSVDELFLPNQSPKMLVFMARERNLVSDRDLRLLEWYVNTQI